MLKCIVRIIKVHCTWLKAAKHGYELPMEVPELTPSHMHWLMQPSCSDDRIPSGWYLVRLICLSKEKISSRYVRVYIHFVLPRCVLVVY